MLDTLLMPLTFPFMQRAFFVGLILSAPTAMLSCFLVLKGWALMGDSVSHATLPGIVLAWILGLPLIIGAFGAGMSCSLLIGYFSGNSRIKYDTVMGVVFSGLFGIGVLMMTTVPSSLHFSHVLFGNMLGIGPKELWTSGLVGLTIVLILGSKWRDFLLQAFDPIQAKASGLPVRFLHYALLACLSLTIVSTLSAVGLILTVALLVTPGAIARLLTRQFRDMLIVACLACFSAVFLGAYISFFIDSAPAPTIILVLTAYFVAAFIYNGLKTRQQNNKSLAQAGYKS